MIEGSDPGCSHSHQHSSIRDRWFWQIDELQPFITTKLVRSHCTHLRSPNFVLRYVWPPRNRRPRDRAVAERLLGGTIDLVTDRRNPRGCLIVQGALACGETSESVRREVAARRLAGEVALRERFERARADGVLPAEADSADLARYVVTVTRGLAVQAPAAPAARTCDTLRSSTLRAWPG